MIKILFMYNNWFSPTYGGAVSRWVFETISRLEDNSQIKLILSANRKKALYNIPSKNIQKIYNPTLSWDKVFSFVSRYGKKQTILSYIWCFIVRLHLKKDDTLIIENRLYYALMLRKFGFKGDIYIHLHNELFLNSTDLFLKKLNDNIQGLLSCSEAVIAPLKEKNIELFNKSKIIRNGVNHSIFNPKGYDKKENTILFVGRLVEQKGIHLLLEAYEEILKNNNKCILQIVGAATFEQNTKPTEYEKKVYKKIKTINSKGGNVKLLGFKNHDTELPQLYAEATVVCISSQFTEAFPMVILEAMFSGTVVVAPKLGGIPESKISSDLLYEEGNIAEMTEKLKSILENKCLRIDNEEHNLTIAHKLFSWNNISNEFSKFLNTI